MSKSACLIVGLCFSVVSGLFDVFLSNKIYASRSLVLMENSHFNCICKVILESIRACDFPVGDRINLCVCC